MPRQGRIDIIGCIYHIIIRGINGEIIFRDNEDRLEFIKRLSEAIKSTGNICYGWAIMSNHSHLLIRRGKKPISDLMRKLLTGYALYFNRRHKRRGYLFQNRYKSILCEEEKYLLELIRYIHLNPLRARIVKDIESLSEYPWTGYSALMGKEVKRFQEVEEVLGRFGKKRKDAAKELKKFMEEGIKQGKREDLTGGGLRRSAGGWEAVLEMKRRKEYWRGDERILGEGEFVDEVLRGAEHELEKTERNQREGYTFDYLLEKLSNEYKIEKKDITKKGRKNRISEAKAVLACIANKELGITGKILAERLKCTQPAISMLIRKGERILEGKNINLLS